MKKFQWVNATINPCTLTRQPLHVGRFGRPFSIDAFKKGKMHELAKL